MPRPSGRAATADVAILTSGHDVADARLHRQVTALQRRGLTVEILALGNAAEAPPGASVRTWRRKGGLWRFIHALKLPFRTAAAVVITFDPDVAATSWLWRRFGLRRWFFVSDVHEDYDALLRDREWARGIRLIAARALARVGTHAACEADLTVVADYHILARATRRLVLRNQADLRLLPAPSPLDRDPRAVYIGDIRRSRGLSVMLDAIRSAPAWTLDLVGPVGNTADRELLDRVRHEPGLAGRVRLHPRMPPRSAWELAEGAWVGLLMLTDTPAFRESMPSKLYEYTACGLPVLATSLPRVADFLSVVGNGVTLESASQAARVLNSWTSDPSPLHEMRRAATSWRAQQPDEPRDLAAFAEHVLTLARHE